MSTSDHQGGPDAGRGHTSPETAHERFHAGAARGATTLIVAEDESTSFALTALLQRGQMTVVTAGGGAAALELLKRRGNIDIVLMDIVLPDMDGYETIAAIRGRPWCAELPIIAITGSPMAGERERCIAAGASDVITHPIDTTALLSAVIHWVVDANTGLPPAEP